MLSLGRWSRATRYRVAFAFVATVAIALTPVAPGTVASVRVASSPTPAAATSAPTPSPAPSPTPTAAPPRLDPVAAPPSRPRAITSAGSAELQLINAARGAVGVAPLRWSGCLATIAASNAARVAAQGTLTHADGVSRDWGCGLGSALTGENLAMISAPASDQRAFTLLMSSAPHRANILDPEFRYVGAAWATAGGFADLVQEFG